MLRSAHLLASLLAVITSTARAQTRVASDSPLHLPVNRFEFVVAGDPPPGAKPLAVHNGGATRFTDVRVTRIAYADSARGTAWLVAQPRQSVVAPDELATVGSLCVDASGLRAGTYQATAGVTAREVPKPVAITITLIVTDAGAAARSARPHDATSHCASTVKGSTSTK